MRISIATCSLTSSLPSSEVESRSPSESPSPSDDSKYNEDIMRRHGNMSSIVSPQNHGMKRLKTAHILQLMPHDKFTLVTPHTDPKQPKPSIKPQNGLVHMFWPVILSSASSRRMDAHEKIQFVEKELSEGAISREGKDHSEYNIYICNYPKRPNLAQYGPLSLDTTTCLVWVMLGSI